MQALKFAGLALVLSGAAVREARAEDPCAADVKTFCANVEPGAGFILNCLEDHRPKLSNSCRANLDANAQKAKGLIAEFFDGCGADKERVCPAVQPGGGRLIRCLSLHDYELSPRCGAEIKKIVIAQERVAKLRSACQADAKRLCPSSIDLAGDLVSCLQENMSQLSPECRAENPSVLLEASSLVQTLDEMTSEARMERTIEIIQGISSVAFSRNQISFSYDYLQGLVHKPINLNALTFTSLLVFGSKNEFAVQLKVPVAAAFPTEPGHPTVSGIADINTAFGWAFYAHGNIRQFFAVALQWNSASEALVGAPWLIAPIYVFAIGFNSWLSLAVDVSYFKSFGGEHSYPGVSIGQINPNLVFALPSQLFLSVNVKFGWDFLNQIFVPVMRLQAGKLLGSDRTVSIGVWYQFSMNTVGQRDSFDYGVGASLAYFFDW